MAFLLVVARRVGPLPLVVLATAPRSVLKIAPVTAMPLAELAVFVFEGTVPVAPVVATLPPLMRVEASGLVLFSRVFGRLVEA